VYRAGVLAEIDFLYVLDEFCGKREMRWIRDAGD
jgi:hypothetical protein